MSCFAVLSLSYIPDDNASNHTELARASMSSSILYSSVEPSFSIFLRGVFVYAVQAYSNSSSVYEYAVAEHQNREHSTVSTAQHSTAQHSTA